MKKFILYFGVLLISTLASAQQFQGKAYYFSKTKVDLNFGNRQLSEDQKKMIAERMKSASERTFVLTFNKEASLYTEEEKLETTAGPGPGGGRFRAMMSGFTSNNYYKNNGEGIYHDQREFYGKNFLIVDSLQPIDWVLKNETKKIGNYTCFKAVTTKKVEEIMDWRSIRRKARQMREKSEGTMVADSMPDRKKPPKEIEIVAWYTPEIPISTGPGAYWGLPGLILEVQEGRTVLLCNKIVLNNNEMEPIKRPKKGKELSQEAYNVITQKKIEEMIDQFSTQRGGNFGRRGRN